MIKRGSLIGTTKFNDKGLEYSILSFVPGTKNKSGKYNIKFINSGYETAVQIGSINGGCIHDRLDTSIYGVAAIGYASMVDNKLIYQRWIGMIQRCYSPISTSYKNYGGRGVKVSTRWLVFSNFLEDFKLLPGYDLFESGEDVQLDKDISNGGRGILYSPETCSLIPRLENMQARSTDYATKFMEVAPDGTRTLYKNVKKYALLKGFSECGVFEVLRGNRSSIFGLKLYRVGESVQTTEKIG